ncbi:MAG: hypothetical protein M3Y87_36630 [Myxococcota bacterium]|nr:hypothetical protein [Myxococcota bacterium]
MASRKKRQTTSAEQAPPSDWHRTRSAIGLAIGVRRTWLILDGVEGDAAPLRVALAIAAPADLVPRIRAHDAFARALADIRSALAVALPGTSISIELVPPALPLMPAELSYALESSGEAELAHALDLPASLAADPADEGGDPEDQGHDARTTIIVLRQIEASALRRMQIISGASLRPTGELLARLPEDGREMSVHVPAPSSDDSIATGDRWLPAVALADRAAGKLWLIARLGSMLSIRTGKRMRSLKEKRVMHPDHESAIADFDARVAKQRAAGFIEMVGSDQLPAALVYHEPAIAEMDRPIVRRAARELLALETWTTGLAAQAVVRALEADGAGPIDRELASQLVPRISG